MTKKIKLNYDSKAIDGINSKIEDARNSIEETAEEIEAIRDDIEETIDGVANDKASIEAVTALEDRLVELERNQRVNKRLLDGLEKSKRDNSSDLAKDMHEAHAKAFEKLQTEYNKAYTEVLIPARKAYVEALAELGAINQNAKIVNGEFQREYNKTNESEKREAYRFNKELRRKGIYTSYFHTGKHESQGFGISEETQRTIHDTGNATAFK